eukprot:1581175-Rhodomonas_salina.1
MHFATQSTTKRAKEAQCNRFGHPDSIQKRTAQSTAFPSILYCKARESVVQSEGKELNGHLDVAEGSRDGGGAEVTDVVVGQKEL